MASMFPRRLGRGNIGRDARAMRVALARLGGTVQRRGFYYEPLTTLWTSTSFNYTAYSSVGTPTAIDMSTFTNAPDNTNHIRAYHLYVAIRDSASFPASGCWFAIGPSGAWNALTTYCLGGDYIVSNAGIVAADDNGDLVYRAGASGSGTLDVYLHVLGYFM